MNKTQKELTSIEKALFNILIKKLDINEESITNYIIKIYEKVKSSSF